MKKRNLKSLKLNKKYVSNFESKEVKGKSDIVYTVIIEINPVNPSEVYGSCIGSCDSPWATYECYVHTDDCQSSLCPYV